MDSVTRRSARILPFFLCRGSKAKETNKEVCTSVKQTVKSSDRFFLCGGCSPGGRRPDVFVALVFVQELMSLPFHYDVLHSML